jgi:dTDP-4-dehydrorhamnose reductase
VLDCTRAKADFGIELPHWKDGLRRMLEGLA